MSTFFELFGFLTVLANGLDLLAQSVLLGTVAFLLLLGFPLQRNPFDPMRVATFNMLGRGALAALVTASCVSLLGTVGLTSSLHVSWHDVVSADFMLAGAAKMAAACGLWAIALKRPEVWPAGSIGFFESMKDPEVVQHRIFVLLTIGFAVFEWGVQTGRIASRRLALVFPLLTALGGTLLLTHSHAIANPQEELLIEYTHLPMGILGICAGWARWLEVRGDPGQRRWAGWVWPICFVLIGLLLIDYREA